MDPKTVTTTPAAEAYCATCRASQPARPELIGSRFVCPAGTRFSPHVAYVVADPGIKAWLWVENALVAYQREYSPLRFLPFFGGKGGKGRVELYLLLRFALIALALAALHFARSTPILWTAVVLAAVFMFDILAYHTAGLFSTRWPVNPMRVVLLSLFAFVTLAMCFGVLFAVQREAFTKPISPYQATYFSFITIATVGYGDISPTLDGSPASNFLQLTIVSEIVAGVYFLTVLVAGVVAWVGAPPEKPPTLDEVRVKS